MATIRTRAPFALALTLACGAPPTKETVAEALYRFGEATEGIATTAALPDPKANQRAVEVRADGGSAAWSFEDPTAPAFDRGRVIFSSYPAAPDAPGTLLVGYLDVVRPAPGNLTFATQQAEAFGDLSVRLEMSGTVVLLGDHAVTVTGTVKANGSKDEDDLVFEGTRFEISDP